MRRSNDSGHSFNGTARKEKHLTLPLIKESPQTKTLRIPIENCKDDSDALNLSAILCTRHSSHDMSAGRYRPLADLRPTSEGSSA